MKIYTVVVLLMLVSIAMTSNLRKKLVGPMTEDEGNVDEVQNTNLLSELRLQD